MMTSDERFYSFFCSVCVFPPVFFFHNIHVFISVYFEKLKKTMMMMMMITTRLWMNESMVGCVSVCVENMYEHTHRKKKFEQKKMCVCDYK